MAEAEPNLSNRYDIIINEIFFTHWSDGVEEFLFERVELEKAAEKHAIKLPKNIGDLIYYFRFRVDLPAKIINTQPHEREWIIELAGRARYRFL